MLQCSIVSSHFFILDHRQLPLLYVSLTVGQVDTHPVTGKFRNKTMTVIWSWAKFNDQTWEAIRQKQPAVLLLVPNSCSCHNMDGGNRYKTMTPSSPIAKKTFVCGQLTALAMAIAIAIITIAIALDVPWNKPQTIDFRSRQDHKTGALKQQTQSSPYTGTELENLIPKINVSRVYILDSQAWYLWKFSIPGYTQSIINCLYDISMVFLDFKSRVYCSWINKRGYNTPTLCKNRWVGIKLFLYPP